MEIVNRKYHLEDISVDGTMVFSSTLNIGRESVNWYNVAQDRDQ